VNRARWRHRRDGPQGAGRDPRSLRDRRRAPPRDQGARNVVDHEYEIERDGDTIATGSKKWSRVRESYGVDIAAGEDAALILAITVGA